MDRRTLIGLLGAGAAGFAAGEASGGEEDAAHGAESAGRFHLYLCAFHVAKKDPSFQVEAHHFCSSLSEEVHQCVIFDSRGAKAKILGVEYIISDRIYRGLPDEEKKYYHPHTYEIISGLLMAPDLKEQDETELMGKLLLTWGKTWHTWPDPRTALPMGDPLLMWSAGKDGQLDAEAVARRDHQVRVSTSAVRKRRSHLGPIPNVSAPKSIDELGRQWTDDGPDRPATR